MFTEEQKFRQWWIWVPLSIFVIVCAYSIYQQFLHNVHFGGDQSSYWGLLVSCTSPLFVITLFYFISLKSFIHEEGISFTFFPFVSKQFKWEEIQQLSMVRYGFVGYGIRLFSRYGTVYNIGGRDGLYITLKSGKKCLLGTQKKEELLAALKRMKKEVNVVTS